MSIINIYILYNWDVILFVIVLSMHKGFGALKLVGHLLLRIG